jgi:hypothetical protein
VLACDLMMEIRSSHVVTAEHVTRLERSMPIGSPVIAEQIDLLFQIDRYAERADRGWTRLLARAILSGVVLGEAPTGILTEEKADWLIERIGRDRISSERNLELLARVMARSESSPDWLRELLVELSGQHAATRTDDARGLQTRLSEEFSTVVDEDAVFEAGTVPASEVSEAAFAKAA